MIVVDDVEDNVYVGNDNITFAGKEDVKYVNIVDDGGGIFFVSGQFEERDDKMNESSDKML